MRKNHQKSLWKTCLLKHHSSLELFMHVCQDFLPACMTNFKNRKGICTYAPVAWTPQREVTNNQEKILTLLSLSLPSLLSYYCHSNCSSMLFCYMCYAFSPCRVKIEHFGLSWYSVLWVRWFDTEIIIIQFPRIWLVNKPPPPPDYSINPFTPKLKKYTLPTFVR